MTVLSPVMPAVPWGAVRSAGSRMVAVQPHPTRIRHYGMGTVTAGQAIVSGASQAGQAAATGGTEQLVMSAPSIIGGTAITAIQASAGASAASTAGGAAGTAAASSWAAIAVPVIGAAVVGVTLFLANMFRRGKQKEAATAIVNEIEPKLAENLNGYLSGSRYRSSQAQALANFDAAWQAVIQACSNPDLGSAGQRCISDRDRNACVWKENGQCWNWFVGYRDPIANDPNVKADPVQTATGSWVDPETGEVLQPSSLDLMLTGNTGLLLAAGLAAAALFMGGSGGRR